MNGLMISNSRDAAIPNPAIWNFGDGGASINSWFPAQHTHARAGTYHVTATVTDSNGRSASASIVVTVP
jgi:PKD repeat protein